MARHLFREHSPSTVVDSRDDEAPAKTYRLDGSGWGLGSPAFIPNSICASLPIGTVACGDSRGGGPKHEPPPKNSYKPQDPKWVSSQLLQQLSRFGTSLTGRRVRESIDVVWRYQLASLCIEKRVIDVTLPAFESLSRDRNATLIREVKLARRRLKPRVLFRLRR